MSQRRRAAGVTVVLILMQLHLLFLAELHRHEMSFPAVGRTTAILNSGAPAGTSGHPGHLCLACQIVLRSAVRPVAGKPTPRLVASAFIRLVRITTRARSFEPPVVFGRAPPLSLSFFLS